MINNEEKIRLTEARIKWEKRKSKLSISESYPDVVEISLDLKLDYPNAFSIHKINYTKNYKPTDIAYFEIDCINKDCIHSNLELDNEIRNAVYKKLESCTGHKICKGYNTFNSYQRRQGSCMTRLDYEIKIKYNKVL